MTRIGFAYNQKPDTSARFEGDLDASADSSTGTLDEESSGFARSITARTGSVVAVERLPSIPRADDAYAEWDSPQTIAAVEHALSGLGDVVRLEATPDFPQRLRESRPDIVFNMAEGLTGQNRESHVPAICEFYGVPYSGSDPFTLSLSLNKARTKQMLLHYGIPTAPFALVESLAEAKAVKKAGLLKYPIFAKPVQEGSSKGITERNYIRSPDELLSCVAELLEVYEQPVILEEFLPGAEFTCGVLGNGRERKGPSARRHAFRRLARRRASDLRLRGEVDLGHAGAAARDLRVPGPDRSIAVYRDRARHVARLRALGCRDWSRIDVRLDAAGVPNIVEVNPLPGILPNPDDNSCLPKAAAPLECTTTS